MSADSGQEGQEAKAEVLMANQYTKAEEEGREKPAGANQFTTGKRTGHDEATKDRMRANKAAELLEQELDGTLELKEGRRAAAKILMEYGKPKLSAVEQTVLNQWDQMSEGEVMEMVRALITAHPGLIQQLNLAPKPCATATNAVQQPDMSEKAA